MGFNLVFKGLKPNNFNGMGMFQEWKRGDYQKRYEMEPTKKKKTR